MRRLLAVALACVMMIGMFDHNTYYINANESVESIVSSMTVEQKLEQMIIPAFRTWNDQDLTKLNSELTEALKKYDFGGVILFGQNIKNATQTTDLINSIQKAHLSGGFKSKMFIGVDQEGGRITRLQTGTQMPGNMAIAATGDVSNAYKAANIIGEELAVQGFNLDFAPVVDVNSNPSNPVIGVRSFSEDPKIVAEYGASFVKGLHSKKVMTCLKHFPGHGDTNVDSHTGLPMVDKTYEELLESDLIPYTAIASDTDFIMTAHIQYPQIEKETRISKSSGKKIYLPATLSKKFLTDILRGELGYQGLIITDSMEMDAISKNFGKMDACIGAINAGADMLLIPVNLTSSQNIEEFDTYIKELASKVLNGEISESRINESVTRILNTKNKYGLLNITGDSFSKNAASIVGSGAHRDVEWEIACAGVKSFKNDGVYPIAKDKKVVVLYPQKDQLDSIMSGAGRGGATSVNCVCYGDYSVMLLDSTIKNADVVICLSTCATGKDLEDTGTVNALVEKAKKYGKKTLVLSTNLPYDLKNYNNADGLIACYGPGINVTAAIYKLF